MMIVLYKYDNILSTYVLSKKSATDKPNKIVNSRILKSQSRFV